MANREECDWKVEGFDCKEEDYIKICDHMDVLSNYFTALPGLAANQDHVIRGFVPDILISELKLMSIFPTEGEVGNDPLSETNSPTESCYRKIDGFVTAFDHQKSGTCGSDDEERRNHHSDGTFSDCNIDTASILSPHSYTFYGVCMIVDISGFTKLSGSHCARGKEGLDALQAAICNYMGTLVETIYNYKGDVIKFAGDALICVFQPADEDYDNYSSAPSSSGDDERSSHHISSQLPRRNTSYNKNLDNEIEVSDAQCCIRALNCAWQLRDTISSDALSVHIAVTHGRLNFGIVGGFENKWEFLVSGQCMEDLSKCLDDAPPKSIAVTKAVYELLSPNAPSRLRKQENRTKSPSATFGLASSHQATAIAAHSTVSSTLSVLQLRSNYASKLPALIVDDVSHSGDAYQPPHHTCLQQVADTPKDPPPIVRPMVLHEEEQHHHCHHLLHDGWCLENRGRTIGDCNDDVGSSAGSRTSSKVVLTTVSPSPCFLGERKIEEEASSFTMDVSSRFLDAKGFVSARSSTSNHRPGGLPQHQHQRRKSEEKIIFVTASNSSSRADSSGRSPPAAPVIEKKFPCPQEQEQADVRTTERGETLSPDDGVEELRMFDFERLRQSGNFIVRSIVIKEEGGDFFQEEEPFLGVSPPHHQEGAEGKEEVEEVEEVEGEIIDWPTSSLSSSSTPTLNSSSAATLLKPQEAPAPIDINHQEEEHITALLTEVTTATAYQHKNPPAPHQRGKSRAEDDTITTAVGRSKSIIEYLIPSAFVPLPVNQSIILGSFNMLSELREVTTVFIKWESYSYSLSNPHSSSSSVAGGDDWSDPLNLQEYLVASQEILKETGGFLRQFLVDDKGCVFIAVWGVPTATYHDNCRRAVWAASSIKARLTDMGMATSIGIATGIAYCGCVGSMARQEYAVIGNSVNLSARLMSKAKGAIWADETTVSRLPRDVRKKIFTKLKPLALKGMDAPITPYEYRGDHSRRDSDGCSNTAQGEGVECKNDEDAALVPAVSNDDEMQGVGDKNDNTFARLNEEGSNNPVASVGTVIGCTAGGGSGSDIIEAANQASMVANMDKDDGHIDVDDDVFSMNANRDSRDVFLEAFRKLKSLEIRRKKGRKQSFSENLHDLLAPISAEHVSSAVQQMTRALSSSSIRRRSGAEGGDMIALPFPIDKISAASDATTSATKDTANGFQVGDRRSDGDNGLQVDGRLRFLLYDCSSSTAHASAAMWLKRHCQENGVKVLSFQQSVSDRSDAYGFLGKMFRALIATAASQQQHRNTNERRGSCRGALASDSSYLRALRRSDEDFEREFVSDLLEQIYEHDKETLTRVAWPTVETVFNISRRKYTLTANRDRFYSHSHPAVLASPTGSKLVTTGTTALMAKINSKAAAGVGIGARVDNGAGMQQRCFTASELFRGRAAAPSSPKHDDNKTSTINDSDGDSKRRRRASNQGDHRSSRRTLRMVKLSIDDGGENGVDDQLATGEHKKGKVPHGVIEECLQEIFAYLLRDLRRVIVVENAENIDDDSWRILLSFTSLRAPLLLTMLLHRMNDVGGSEATRSATDTLLGDYHHTYNTRVSAYSESCIRRLLGHTDVATRLVISSRYTFSDVQRLLAQKLNTAEDAVEPELCLMVHRLAGGEVFWTREIISFIDAFGSEDFTQQVLGLSDGGSTDFSINPRASAAKAICGDHTGASGMSVNRPHGGTMTGFLHRSSLRNSDSDSIDGPIPPIMNSGGDGSGEQRMKTLMRTFLTGWGSAEKDSNPSNSNASFVGRKRRNASIHGQSHSSSLVSRQSDPEAKLEFLIICRMARLAPRVANVAKTAAIIGYTFTSDILQAIIAQELQPYLSSILAELVETSWLSVAPCERKLIISCNASSSSPPTRGGRRLSNANGRVSFQYTFMHPLLQRSLYSLTPPSVRAAVHLSIAKVLECQLSPPSVDTAQLAAMLAHHYRRSIVGKDDKAATAYTNKAYDYLVKAIRARLEQEEPSNSSNVDEIIGLLEEATVMAQDSANQYQRKDVLDLVKACIEKAFVEDKRRELQSPHNSSHQQRPPGSQLTLSSSGIFKPVHRSGSSGVFKPIHASGSTSSSGFTSIGWHVGGGSFLKSSMCSISNLAGSGRRSLMYSSPLLSAADNRSAPTTRQNSPCQEQPQPQSDPMTLSGISVPRIKPQVHRSAPTSPLASPRTQMQSISHSSLADAMMCFSSSPLASRSNCPFTRTSPSHVGLSLSPPNLWASSDDSLEENSLHRDSREQSGGGRHFSFAPFPFMQNLHYHSRVYAAAGEDETRQSTASNILIMQLNKLHQLQEKLVAVPTIAEESTIVPTISATSSESKTATTATERLSGSGTKPPIIKAGELPSTGSLLNSRATSGEMYIPISTALKLSDIPQCGGNASPTNSAVTGTTTNPSERSNERYTDLDKDKDTISSSATVGAAALVLKHGSSIAKPLTMNRSSVRLSQNEIEPCGLKYNDVDTGTAPLAEDQQQADSEFPRSGKDTWNTLRAILDEPVHEEMLFRAKPHGINTPKSPHRSFFHEHELHDGPPHGTISSGDGAKEPPATASSQHRVHFPGVSNQSHCIIS